MSYTLPIISKSQENLKIKVWNCKRKKIFSNSFIQRYYEYMIAAFYIIINHQKYDYVVIWQQMIGFLLSLFPVNFLKKVIISTVLYSDNNTKKNFIKNFIFRNSVYRVKALIYYSEEMCNEGKIFFKKYSEKFYFTHIPILFEIETPMKKSNFERIIDSEKTIFCGGKSDRDFETVISAFKHTDIPVIIVCSDNEYISNVDEATKNIRIIKFSEINSSHSEFYHLAKKAFCILISLKNEDSPCGQLLFSFAMSNNKPIIASNSKGVRDYITNDYNGLLVSVGDSKAIQDAYYKLSLDFKLHNKLIENSKYIFNKMTFSNYISNIYKIILN